jgi:hypothetical protein
MMDTTPSLVAIRQCLEGISIYKHTRITRRQLYIIEDSIIAHYVYYHTDEKSY